MLNKKFNKKILAALTLAMGVTLLAGCGEGRHNIREEVYQKLERIGKSSYTAEIGNHKITVSKNKTYDHNGGGTYFMGNCIGVETENLKTNDKVTLVDGKGCFRFFKEKFDSVDLLIINGEKIPSPYGERQEQKMDELLNLVSPYLKEKGMQVKEGWEEDWERATNFGYE